MTFPAGDRDDHRRAGQDASRRHPHDVHGPAEGAGQEHGDQHQAQEGELTLAVKGRRPRPSTQGQGGGHQGHGHQQEGCRDRPDARAGGTQRAGEDPRPRRIRHEAERVREVETPVPPDVSRGRPAAQPREGGLGKPHGRGSVLAEARDAGQVAIEVGDEGLRVRQEARGQKDQPAQGQTEEPAPEATQRPERRRIHRVQLEEDGQGQEGPRGEPRWVPPQQGAKGQHQEEQGEGVDLPPLEQGDDRPGREEPGQEDEERDQAQWHLFPPRFVPQQEGGAQEGGQGQGREQRLGDEIGHRGQGSEEPGHERRIEEARMTELRLAVPEGRLLVRVGQVGVEAEPDRLARRDVGREVELQGGGAEVPRPQREPQGRPQAQQNESGR